MHVAIFLWTEFKAYYGYTSLREVICGSFIIVTELLTRTCRMNFISLAELKCNKLVRNADHELHAHCCIGSTWYRFNILWQLIIKWKNSSFSGGAVVEVSIES